MFQNYEFAESNLKFLLSDLYIDHPIITQNGEFDMVTYQKGGAAIRQLAAVISAETLRKGLQNYLVKYKFSNANYMQLLAEIQDAVSGTDLKDWCGENFNVFKFMDLWLTQRDHPILEVGFEDGYYLIRQDAPNENERFWAVPLFTQGVNGKRKLFWSARKSISGSQIAKADLWLTAISTGPYFHGHFIRSHLRPPIF